MTRHTKKLGLGIGWRDELALFIDRRPEIGFVEVVAENISRLSNLPRPIVRLRERGAVVVPHGISLSLGGAESVDLDRVRALDQLARRLEAPLVSEHIAFVRAGDVEAGHLLPPPRTRPMLEIIVDNVRAAQDALSVPLALENIASLFEWPGAELAEAEFIAEIIDRTGARLLLDVENIHANACNQGFDPLAYLDSLPLARLAYVHVAGGVERAGVYHDTHAHSAGPAVLNLLEELAARAEIPGVLLERDEAFPSAAKLDWELSEISAAVARGAGRRELRYVRA